LSENSVQNEVLYLVQTQQRLEDLIKNKDMNPKDIENVLSELTQTQRSSLKEAEVINNTNCNKGTETTSG